MDVSLVMLCLTHEVTTLCVECYKCTITSNSLLKSCHSNQNSPSILHDQSINQSINLHVQVCTVNLNPEKCMHFKVYGKKISIILKV